MIGQLAACIGLGQSPYAIVTHSVKRRWGPEPQKKKISLGPRLERVLRHPCRGITLIIESFLIMILRRATRERDEGPVGLYQGWRTVMDQRAIFSKEVFNEV
ncbi:hypothetical protein TNCV_2879591 [Trichonephila clavipes]|uniref:Uncharacterized protein n=1 Tax=Trichonephila clavipes TaxID=2585209 RepID=A0A8X6W2C9_TRICX|nr:hypothetical protein TNCV_2879591 [Trichonephila clavipes]